MITIENSYLVPFISGVEDFDESKAVYNENRAIIKSNYGSMYTIYYDTVDEFVNSIKTDFSYELIKSYIESSNPSNDLYLDEILMRFVGKANSLGYIYVPKFIEKNLEPYEIKLEIYGGSVELYCTFCYSISDTVKAEINIPFFSTYYQKHLYLREETWYVYNQDIELNDRTVQAYVNRTATATKHTENVIFSYDDVYIDADILTPSYEKDKFVCLKDFCLEKVMLK